LRAAPASARDSSILSEQTQLHTAEDYRDEYWESDLWPLEFESNNSAGFEEDSSHNEYNTGDTSFMDYPERTGLQEGPGGPSGGANTQPDIASREVAAPTFIPGSAAQPARENGSATPFRANPGSIYIPSNDLPQRREPQRQSTPFAAPPTAPMREHQEWRDASGTLEHQQSREREVPRTAVGPAAASEPAGGYGWNGESDPRLHQEWLNQVASAGAPDTGDDEKSLKRVIEEVGAKQRIAASGDYYQILGVDKLASNGSITKAFERITRINENHKSRWPRSAELQAQISSLMVVVNKAFETLSNAEKRRLYDMPPKEQTPAMEIERGSGAPTRSLGPGAIKPGATSAKLPPQASRPLAPPAAAPGLPGPVGAERRNPYEAAEELYKRGRACFAQSDLQAAAHLLRQAVTLDPNRSTYHYQLAMTLFILSQARTEHKHDKGCHVTCKMGGNLTRNQRIRHEAEQHLLKASELEPSNSDIKLKLALVYKDANMDRKAHQYFYEALMLDPNCHIARVELGMEDTRNKDENQWIKELMRDRAKKK
jgi:tetratricopeptide (TPR) repeat protein